MNLQSKFEKLFNQGFSPLEICSSLNISDNEYEELYGIYADKVMEQFENENIEE